MVQVSITAGFGTGFNLLESRILNRYAKDKWEEPTELKHVELM